MNKWMNGLRWALGVTLLGTALTLGGVGLVNLSVGGAWAESEHDDDDRRGERDDTVYSNRGQSEIDPVYVEECSACHLAYPAQLLPERSWRTIMAGLDDHFGESAELPEATAKRIEDYLAANAADVNPGRRSKKFLRGITDDQTPLRITQTRYFKGKHDEVPQRLVSGNPEVGSFSQCQACHGEAAQRGVFDEDTVDIPGYGRWDD
ncbi:diheme cytochrome c [Marinobacterium lacunae]|uniref:Diheme cytochrome c n=1 Tax=Marinobacterium lacunae TaxID=1232683 RepID=A0A081G3F0_9GAMM|nr:diheme cytochrome c [Marinobacterium lacunae]KEA65305.1 diheme cytochrome c [Marinobacterium lacunae]